MPPLERARKQARVFGFAALLGWALLGSALEAAHAFKLASYLDHPLRRELLTWGHAHGVGLALVVLSHAANWPERDGERASVLLRVAAMVMPLGFVLSIFWHSESDPGPAIWLVPLGALSLLVGLWRAFRAAQND